ncbi:MAG: CBS domain-containing protein [Candidatus Promineifilaceae bacterium]|nr:CBS domain-containing protein [Candidatus Promineifilaceae bacterium]
MKQELVREWMTPEPITATPDTTLPHAHRLLMENRIRRLPVVEKGRLVGIITRGDIRGAQPSDATSLTIWEMNYLLSQLKLKSLMTPRPITVHEDATIAEAARLMLRHKVSGLPVVDAGDTLVGIITESDIFRLVVRTWQEEAVPEPVPAG